MKWKLVPIEPTLEMYSASQLTTESEGIVTTTWLRSAVYRSMLEAAPQPPKLSDKRLFHYAAEIRKALEPDPVGATLNIVALLRAIEREILGCGEK